MAHPQKVAGRETRGEAEDRIALELALAESVYHDLPWSSNSTAQPLLAPPPPALPLCQAESAPSSTGRAFLRLLAPSAEPLRRTKSESAASQSMWGGIGLPPAFVREESTVTTRPQQTCSQTALTLMGLTVGAGMFTLPKAMELAGFVGGCLLIVFSGAFMGWTLMIIGDLLGRINQRADVQAIRPENRLWNTIGRCSLGPRGGAIASAIVLLDLVTALWVLMVMAAVHLTALVPALPNWVSTAFIGLALLGLVFYKVEPSWLSTFGLVAQGIAVALMVITTVELEMTDGIATDKIAWAPRGLPLSFSMLLFSFIVHGEAPTYYQMMEYPEEWRKAVTWAFGGAVVIFASVAALGYYTFGSSAQSTFVENIGKDTHMAWLSHPLPEFVNKWILADGGNLLISFKLIMQLPGLMLPIMNEAKEALGIEEAYGKENPQVKAGVVVFVGISTLIAALFVNQVQGVIELAGSVACNVVCIIFPILFHLVLKWQELSIMERVVLILVDIIFVVYALWGFWSSAEMLCGLRAVVPTTPAQFSNTISFV